MSKQYPGGLITKTPVVPSGPYQNSTASGIWTLDQQAYWAKLGQWPTAGNSDADPQFNYVTMLLHGDGTNGAQNNTFLDSSTNNFTITRNGNTTQGSFSPYGSNWGNAFTAASGDYLSVPYSSVFNLTGDFTVECWINPSQLPTANATGSPLYPRIFSFGTYNAANSIGLELNSNDPGRVNAFSIWYNGTQSYSANSLVAVGNWYHCAMVRSGTVITLYLNGTSILTITGASAAVNTSQALLIASLHSYTADANACFKGSISNFRVVKGTAVYTSSFTPPTTPLTAITNTVLLTCQSNRFVDNSTTAATITPFGTSSVQRFNPFGASTAYSTSVIGGSAYFDGSGDSLSLPNDVALDFGTGDFTIEVWIYPTSLPTSYQCVFITCNNTASAGGIGLFTQSTGEIEVYDFAGNGAVFSTSGFNLKTNQWTNIAVTRSGSTNTLYKNGVSFATATNSSNYNSSTDTVIGNSTAASQTFYGYISALRVLKGTAQAPTITTPPTNITNTSLLLNMTNGAIFDNAMMNDLETVGNAQISTSVKKYGTGSASFDGSTSYLRSPLITRFGLTFTIEFWMYPTINSGNEWMVCSAQGYNAAAPNHGFLIGYFNGVVNSSIAIAGTGLGAYWINCATVVTTNAWHHIAVVGDGTSCVVYLDGVNIGSSAWPSGYTGFLTNGLLIGAGCTSSLTPINFYGGYIDDLRITNGYARYTANFTPPTAAFFNIGPT
jgi:hypothetical protein